MNEEETAGTQVAEKASLLDQLLKRHPGVYVVRGKDAKDRIIVYKDLGDGRVAIINPSFTRTDVEQPEGIVRINVHVIDMPTDVNVRSLTLGTNKRRFVNSIRVAQQPGGIEARYEKRHGDDFDVSARDIVESVQTGFEILGALENRRNGSTSAANRILDQYHGPREAQTPIFDIVSQPVVEPKAQA